MEILTLEISNERLLKALRTSPWLQEAQRNLEAEHLRQRHDDLRKVEESNAKFIRVDKALAAKAGPMGKRIQELRAELTSLEAQFEQLARERASAMHVNSEEVRLIRMKLREEADECAKLLHAIDATRSEISHNIGGRRETVLHGDTSDARMAHAMVVLLKAYQQVERIAVEEADVTTALDQIRRQLAAERISLV